MDGWFDTFLDKLLIVFFAIFGGAARFAIAPPVVRSMWGCVGSLIIAGFAGILAWQLLEGLGFSTQTVAAGVGIAGLLGDDILKAILKLGVKLREDPLNFLDRFLKSRFGSMFTSAHSTHAREKYGEIRERMESVPDMQEKSEEVYLDKHEGKAVLQRVSPSDEELTQKQRWELVGVPEVKSTMTNARRKHPRKIKRLPADDSSSIVEEDGGEDQ